MYQDPFWGPLPETAPDRAVEHPHATTVLLLGALSVFCCGALGPVAWVMGRKALSDIDRSYGGIGGRTQVMVGYVLGIIGTTLMVLIAIVYILMLAGGRA